MTYYEPNPVLYGSDIGVESVGSGARMPGFKI